MITQPLNALPYDPVGLPHLLDAHQIAIITIAVDANRNVKIKQIVDFIGLLLAQIPFHTRATQHRAGESHCLGPLGRDDADTDQALFPDPVVSQQGFIFVDVMRKAIGEVLNEVQQRSLPVFVKLTDRLGVAQDRCLVLGHCIGQITIDAARPVVGRMQTRAGYGFVAIHQVFPLTEGIQEHTHCADVERMRAEPEQVV